MHVVIMTSHNNFELNFEGKFNFLLGNSGTRKTLLLKDLLKYKRGIKSVKCKIETDGQVLKKENVHVLTNEVIIEGDYHNLFNTTGDVYFIDESCSILHEQDIASVLFGSNNYFVIISRSLAGWLPVSIDSVYRLHNDNGVIKNVPEYCSNNQIDKLL